MLKNLMPLETIFTIIAWTSSLLFSLKLVLLILGSGEHSDTDSDFDSHESSDVDFKLLSLQSFLAFGMGLGWLGKAVLCEWKWGSIASIFAGASFGILMMVFSAFLMSQLRRLNHHYEPRLEECIGLVGQTYLSIPEKGIGQVEVPFGGKMKILDAMSNTYDIPQFRSVQIVAIKNGILVVEPVL